MFDIVDFYSSISVNLLLQALTYAKKFVSISDEDIEVIMHTRKSLLFENNNVWCKRGNTDLFDVTMGSHDGAKVCELVGLLILDKLQTVFKNDNIGLYRDDGLAVFRNMGPRTADKVRKRFADCFARFGLKITIQTNLKIVNYLDISLNLNNGTYQP